MLIICKSDVLKSKMIIRNIKKVYIILKRCFFARVNNAYHIHNFDESVDYVY